MASKTTYFCDFCGAKTENLSRIKGEIWFEARSRSGDTRKTIVDCTSEIVEICSSCREKAATQLEPFNHFMKTSGEMLIYRDDEDEQTPETESYDGEVSGDAE